MGLFKPALAPGDVFEIGGAPVRLRVDARARRVSLRIHAAAREVVATAPTARKLADALRFAEQREAWIADRLAALHDPLPLHPGATIEVDGAPCVLERAAMRITPRYVPPTCAEPGRLIASGEGEAFERAALRGLKALALERVSDRSEVHASALRQPLPDIHITNARSRWGSCKGPTGGTSAQLRYSWRLVMAPPEVLDYVAAHECAHLIEANHSPAFWAVVRRLYGDPRAARRWLKTHGARLHAVGG